MAYTTFKDGKSYTTYASYGTVRAWLEAEYGVPREEAYWLTLTDTPLRDLLRRVADLGYLHRDERYGPFLPE